MENERAKLELFENEKLLKRLIRDIKSFVLLMHDAVVRFYKLDVKTSIDVNQCECLTEFAYKYNIKEPNLQLNSFEILVCP